MAGSEALVYFLVSLSVSLLLVRATSAPNIEEICHHWGDIARQMSGDGRIQNCKSPSTTDCARLDCTGTITFRHLPLPVPLKEIIQFDYCFGIELRSCNSPQFMDFYLQVPNKNFTDTVRFSEDREYSMKDLRYTVGPLGYVYPDFTFTYERQTDSSILFSVLAHVKAHPVVGSDINTGMTLTLIKDEKVYPLPCDKTTHDQAGKPPANFVGGKCVPGIYVPDVSPTMISYTPSATLHKKCDLTSSFCDDREICDTSRKPHLCTCNEDSQLSPKNDSCMSLAKLNQHCRENSECGSNEECVPSQTKKMTTCQCKHGYAFDTHRGMCSFSGSSKSSDVKPAVSTPKPSHTATTGSSHHAVHPHRGGASHSQPESVEDVEAEGKHNWPIYIGAALGSALAVGILVWGVIYLVRRRRQQHSSTDAELRVPLMGNDDSDNMIM